MTKNYNRLSDMQIANRILKGDLSNIEERKKILGKRYDSVQNLVTNSLLMKKEITAPKKELSLLIQDIADGKWGDSKEVIEKKLNFLGYENIELILNKVEEKRIERYKEIAEKFNNKEFSYSQLLDILKKEKINYDKIQSYLIDYSENLQKGDYVYIEEGAKDFRTGRTFPSYALKSKYLIKKVNKKTVVIGDSKTDMMTIDKKFIIKE